MDKESTEKLIKNTFQNSFNKEKYVYFIKNLLKRYDESKAFHLQGCYIPKAFENFIKVYERIGTYIDPEGKKTDLLIVYLKKETTLDRARTAQRNFVAHYLKERGEKDAGLVAFVSPEEEDWRFSFVKMEYKFEKTPTGDVKIKEEFTPARRYSFLVGKNESSHTAQNCFIDILKNDDYNLKIYELEKTFSIEKVTKEFFEKYRNLFLEIKDSLEEIVKRNEEIRQEFQEKGINTVDFSKKLLGQIVFLYFLQKKGWFGIEKGQKWDSGSKHFLRELFEKKHCDYKNFFNDVLEPLFYEALRNDRSYDDHYFSYFKCKIPFLNGGLFDPLNDYDWAKTDILLPDNLFSNNNKTKEGDIGTGVLDVFDRYNFTVKEDEPLEKEVAVDPEMLGKVFENLLEVKDRKSKGTYYTPREIVHYMCQRSLINYLFTEVNDKQKHRIEKQNIQMKLLGKPDPVQQDLIIERNSNMIPKEDIEKLIKYGDSTVEHNHTTLDEFSKNPNYKGSYKNYKLPQSIVNNAELIDDKLKSIKVCDPAVGSGAFLVGMMNEIIRARNALTPILLSQKDSIKQSIDQSHTSTVMLNNNEESRTIYDLKRHAIQNCLYGVDIDPGAVEIAKLRLWLSLIVDEEDINKIKPLPNLDYKIMQGNSLISEFMGIDLDNDKQNNENAKLFSTDESKELYEMLKVKKDELLNQPIISKKKILKKEIEDLIINIFELKLQKQKSEYFKKIREIEEKYEQHPIKEEREKEIKKEKDVLSRRAGFNLDEVEKQLRQYTSNQSVRPFFPWKLYFSEVFQGKDGFDVVIANPPYINTKRGIESSLKNLYKKIYKSAQGQFDLFTIFIEKGIELTKNGITYIIPKPFINNENYEIIRELVLNSGLYEIVIGSGVFEEANVESCLFFVSKIFYSKKVLIMDFDKGEFKKHNLIEKHVFTKLPFKMINTEINSKDIKIFEKMNKNITKLGEITNITRGVECGKNDKVITKQKTPFKLLRGEDVKKYLINYKNIFIKFSEKNPQKFKFSSLYCSNKILIRRVSKDLICTMDDNKFVVLNTLYCCITKSNYALSYIVAMVNSKLISYWFKKMFVLTDKLFPYVRKSQLNFIPIKDIEQNEQKPFTDLVNCILAITKDDDYLANSIKQVKVKEYERQIDQMVYKLYGITEEEIKIMEEERYNED
ncbi:MAG: Eco57I restriction-modification methylase domain-containing protein [Candidatus Atribacteria bacterium]|nr:Eco57I restriction-modification methylase domain-containing protein [Candidatus Atribacteria bacterium]